MTRSPLELLTLLMALCGVMSALSCVEPPPASAPLCQSDVTQTLCQEDNESGYTTCCTTLNEEFANVDPTPEQQSFIAACVAAFPVATSQKNCLDLLSDVKPGWNASRAVTECVRLHTEVGGLDGDNTFRIPCIDHLVNTAFTPSPTTDPVALIAFCRETNDAITTNKSNVNTCIEKLSQFSWFPGPVAGESQSFSGWEDDASQGLPALCDEGECFTTEDIFTCLDSMKDLRLTLPNHELIVKMFNTEILIPCTLCIEPGSSMCRRYEPLTCQLETSRKAPFCDPREDSMEPMSP